MLTPVLTPLSVALLATGFASHVSGAYSPRVLFTQGQQGAWYDPSDLSTLFQDAAGTIPVTGMEQPVGLMLDKRLGLVRGAELVVNGDFSGGLTGWAQVIGTISVTAGVLRVARGGGNIGRAVSAAMTCTIGKSYEVSYTKNKRTSGSSGLIITTNATSTVGSIFTVNNGAEGAGRAVFTATQTTHWLFCESGSGVDGDYAEFDNISVRELPGNHATQATAAQRPILTARKNLLLNTPLAGGTAGIVGAGAVAPTGWSFGAPAPSGEVSYPVTSFDTIGVRFQAVAQRPGLTRILTALANTVYSNHARITALVGSLEIQNAVWAVGFPGDAVRTFWRNGVTVASNTIVAAGDHVAVIVTMGATAGTFQARFGAGTQTNATCDVTMTMPQVEVSAAPTRYQWVNTPTDYDYIGFPIGLSCDGVDDGMVTGNINFTGTDKMFVCAGIRTLSTVTAAVVELSADAGANNGTFLLAAYVDAGNNFRFRAKGTLQRDATSTPTYRPPVSVVAVGQANIPGDTAAMRLNGTPDGENAGDLGTGDFGNYPLYLFRRGGASLPFNGLFYGAIIAGSTYSAAQIASAERYLAGKSGVTL